MTKAVDAWRAPTGLTETSTKRKLPPMRNKISIRSDCSRTIDGTATDAKCHRRRSSRPLRQRRRDRQLDKVSNWSTRALDPRTILTLEAEFCEAWALPPHRDPNDYAAVLAATAVGPFPMYRTPRGIRLSRHGSCPRHARRCHQVKDMMSPVREGAPAVHR